MPETGPGQTAVSGASPSSHTYSTPLLRTALPLPGSPCSGAPAPSLHIFPRSILSPHSQYTVRGSSRWTRGGQAFSFHLKRACSAPPPFSPPLLYFLLLSGRSGVSMCFLREERPDMRAEESGHRLSSNRGSSWSPGASLMQSPRPQQFSRGLSAPGGRPSFPTGGRCRPGVGGKPGATLCFTERKTLTSVRGLPSPLPSPQWLLSSALIHSVLDGRRSSPAPTSVTDGVGSPSGPSSSARIAMGLSLPASSQLEEEPDQVPLSDAADFLKVSLMMASLPDLKLYTRFMV